MYHVFTSPPGTLEPETVKKLSFQATRSPVDESSAADLMPRNTAKASTSQQKGRSGNDILIPSRRTTPARIGDAVIHARLRINPNRMRVALPCGPHLKRMPHLPELLD